MKDKLYIGIDNGTSGTIGFIYNNETVFVKTPVRKEQNYTKKKGNISRVDFDETMDLISQISRGFEPNHIFALIERPMVNPTRFKATISAIRALEATLNVLETLGIPHAYIDSKEWQKELLPSGTKGAPELKKASLDIGIRLFPQHKELIEKHKDADGMLICEYARRKY